jgi:hypothetical protein
MEGQHTINGGTHGTSSETAQNDSHRVDRNNQQKHYLWQMTLGWMNLNNHSSEWLQLMLLRERINM